MKNPSSIISRVFYGDQEITDLVERFMYKQDEEGDDECTLTIRSDDVSVCDSVFFQNGARLKVMWGYLQTNQYSTQTVYVIDADWEYGVSNITGTVKACEKGISLKHSSSDKAYQNTSLVGVAKSVGDKHGLNTIVEIPANESSLTGPKTQSKPLIRLLELGEDLKVSTDLIQENLPPIQVLVPGDIQKQIQESAKIRREIDSVSKKLYGITYDQIVEDSKLVPINLKSVQNSILLQKTLSNMKTYPFVAQGNKTDSQMLNELGMKEPGGPYIAETRDDNLIIRKRNFRQAPYKSYTYKGEGSELLEFSSQPKHRGRKGSSVNMSFGAWDSLNKQYQEGNANNVNDKKKALVDKYLELYDNYQEVEKQYPGLIVGFRESGSVSGAPVGAYSGAGDNTNVAKSFRVPITVMDKIKIVEDKLNLLGVNVTPNKKFVNPENDTIEESFDQSSNLRNNSELKKNYSSARLVGDPRLKVGLLITILGVGKKNSGNFYIAGVTHTVDSSGYFTSLDKLYKHGSNVKVNNNYISYKDAGKTINNQIGPEGGTPSTKIVGVEQNIR